MEAQSIRGAVVEIGGAAVPGVVVLLLNSADSVVARSLADERGAFRIGTRTGGRFRLRALRLGFRPTTTEFIELRPGQELAHEIVLAAVPVRLDTVRVTRRSVCHPGSDSAAATQLVWEQARVALTALDLSTRALDLVMRIVTYKRSLDPASLRVREQSSAVQSGLARQPWISPSAGSLRRAGYVVRGDDGWLTFHAPDLSVLLSETFREDHCFRLVRSSDPGIIGLAFEPTGDRKDVPEIGGTLWLHGGSSELRSLDFRYVNVGSEADQAGGDMDFVRIANGAWAISRWSIRTPVFQRRVGATRVGSLRVPVEAMSATAVRVGGGELFLVTRDNDTLWSRAPLILSGYVRDSSSGQGIAGARVSISGTQLGSVTNTEGRFAIAGVLPGGYVLSVRTTSLDSLNYQHETPFEFSGNAAAIIRLRAALDLAHALCPPVRLEGRSLPGGMVVGLVRLPSDSTPRDVDVIVEWQDLSVRFLGADNVAAGRRTRVVRTRADSAGGYRACGLPSDTQLQIRAEAGAVSAADTARIPPGRHFIRADLVLTERVMRPHR